MFGLQIRVFLAVTALVCLLWSGLVLSPAENPRLLGIASACHLVYSRRNKWMHRMIKHALANIHITSKSEGNVNRAIHQVVPDHRVKLTDDGRRQAAEAGRRLRKLLRPDDTLQFYTSPYRRTRETTEGILRTLTAKYDDDEPHATPSPFDRSRIKVYEEPRLREQDWGNYQPCSDEMERMWKERAAYGHFFYRISNGESAADAYDRVSGFNESLWRQFGETSFPSVCVLVTHGLMTRIFLMKWYHWSVEYFEDLRNINHCEFIIMKQNLDNGKFILQNELRTWSQLERLKAEQVQTNESVGDLQRRNTLSHFLKDRRDSSSRPARKESREQDTQQKIGQTPSLKPDYKITAASSAPPAAASENLLAPDELPIRSKPDTSLSPGEAHDDALTPHDAPRSASYFDKSSVDGSTSSPSSGLRQEIAQEDRERWAAESGVDHSKQADALGDAPHDDDHDDDHTFDDIAEAEEYDRSIRGSVY